jgi:multiple sugar transport system substrate-binding protein
MSTQVDRRNFLKITGASVAAAATAGSVVPARSYARQSDEPVTLTWWDYMTAANGQALESQIQRYMDTHPNVTIERNQINFGDLKQRLLQGATAGALPDIVIIDNPDHQAFSSLGIFEDITDLVAEWGQAENFFQGPWDSTMFNGRNYGIPDNSNCLVLWYNTSFLEEAQIGPPTNWEELVSAAEALTVDGRYGMAVAAIQSEIVTFQWLPFLWATGEDLDTLDSEGGRRALQLWVDMVDSGSMSRGILGWDQTDIRVQFQNGQTAMMPNGPWQIPTIREESPDLPWDVATLPADQQGASILGGENTAIVQGTQHLEAAWELLTWRQEPEELTTYLLEAGKLPSREDLAEDSEWTQDPVINTFIEQLRVAKPRAYGENYPEISSAVQNAIQAAISGQTDVESALAQAQETITPLLPES